MQLAWRPERFPANTQKFHHRDTEGIKRRKLDQGILYPLKNVLRVLRVNTLYDGLSGLPQLIESMVSREITPHIQQLLACGYYDIQSELESLKGKRCCRQVKFYCGVSPLISGSFSIHPEVLRTEEIVI
jgi:hypothetical protein